MPYSVKGFFEINENMVQILLMLEVLFTQDYKVEDLFCGIQCYIINFKHTSQAVLEKKIFKYISFLNPRCYVSGSFWTPGPPSDQTC